MLNPFFDWKYMAVFSHGKKKHGNMAPFPAFPKATTIDSILKASLRPRAEGLLRGDGASHSSSELKFFYGKKKQQKMDDGLGCDY